MSKQRALQDLMTAVDDGHVVDVHVDSEKLIAPPRSSYGGRGRKSAPPAAPAVETSSDTSFEFSAVVSYSSASPASMVFSDGQLRAHQFPAMRSSAVSSQAASPMPSRSASVSSGSGSAKAAGVTGSTKRVSFAMDGADKVAAAKGGQGKKSGGLLGCCGASRNEVVEPARNTNRKVVAV
ncbi:hypothetical protein BAE44_0012389 [Dichanthelium oligosanthes]|uniref:Uncharacterized protein n=1 Tax=Dichanthelium oligosanthes TaxID=888268 RepID=A0A1E5VND6_9POAL|nr:hypothetical protein BAE44_0012389 [Dichanthelium oligosanthes]